MRFQRAYLIGFALHFFLLVTVASRDFFAVLADGSSYLPATLEPRWRVLEDATFTVLGQKLPPNNPMRETIAFYLHTAGIEAGYGYFAPNASSDAARLYCGQPIRALTTIDSKNAGLFRLATSSRCIKDSRRIWGRDYTIHGGLQTRRRAELCSSVRLRFWVYFG